MHFNRTIRPLLQLKQAIPSKPAGATAVVKLWLTFLAFALLTPLSNPHSAAAQQTSPSKSATQPTQPAPHPEDHHGPPNHFLLPHPEIHPPKGKIPQPGTAVIFDATGMGSPLVLDHNWRLGIAPGEEPAKSDFDDSQWPTRDAKEALAEVDDSAADDDEANHDSSQHSPPGGPSAANHPHGPHGHPFAWFRIHVKLPAQHGPLVVLVRVPVSRNSQMSFNGTVGMDLFVDGKEVEPEGPNPTTAESYQQISRIYPIKIPSTDNEVILAVRIPFTPFGPDAYTNFFSHRTFLIGEREDLVSHLDLWTHAMLFERLPSLVDSSLKVMLALFLIALFFTQKDHPEYLWLALQLLTVAGLAFFGLVGSMGRVEQLLMFAMVIQLLLIAAYFYFEFLIAFLSLRRRWYIIAMRYSAPLLLAFGPLLLAIHNGRTIEVSWVLAAFFAIVWIICWAAFVGLTLTIAAIHRNYEAALLLLPLLLGIVGLVELISTAGAETWIGNPVQSPLTFEVGPIPIHFSDFADFVGIFVIILIIFVRFLRIHRERERASSELAAARSVQELMIPRESPRTPGFQVETVYNPATEVGGDFFHIEATPNGGLLIIIGDVAGHGLQAAMNVSMLMGALRRSPLGSPAEMLAGLNQVLVGSSSFTTCEVALFAPDGELTIASAGHPPPYLNSQEVPLAGGLPLGVIADVTYEETSLYLHPGDRLLMMSDGVAEARKSNGEMFGFDRVRNLSNQSAFFIAEAAKDFGQEDDITVLTVRRLATAVAA
jgi:hypothetical protein